MNATMRQLLVRERLHAILDDEAVRIALLNAPSGYGKTTLLRMWIDSGRVEGRVLWITFSASTTTRNSVYEQIALGALRAGFVTPEQCEDLRALINSDDFEKRELIAAMQQEEPFTIILDGYERLGELAPVVDEDFLRGSRHVPGMRVLIAARGRTTLTQPRHQLDSSVRVISEADLAFTTDEVQEFYDLVVGSSQHATALEISAATHGYPLAVRAAMLELARSGPSDVRWRENALNSANLSAQLPGERIARFARITSIVPYFDSELAGLLDPDMDAEAAIEVLEADGFGRRIPSAGGGAFQYVSALREALHEELRAESASEYGRIASIAAEWLAAQGELDAALQLALDAHEHGLAADIVRRMLLTVVEAYTSDRLESTLQHLPHEMLVAWPVLAFALGLARLANPVLRHGARPLLQIAAGMRIPSETDLQRRCELLCFKVFALRTLGRYRESALLAQEVLELSSAGLEPTEVPRISPVFTRGLALSIYLVGDAEGADLAVASTFVVPQSKSSRNLSFSDAAGFKAIEGDMHAANALLAQIDASEWASWNERGHLGTFGHVARSYAYLERGEWMQARETLSDTERHTVTAELWTYLQEPVMLARLAQGEALAEARRVEELLDGPLARSGQDESLGRFRVKSLLAVLWLASGRPGRARRLLEEHSVEELRTRPIRSLLALFDGDTDQSMRWVSQSLDAAKSPRLRMALHLIGAAGSFRDGDQEVALSMVGLASGLARDYGLLSPLLMLPDSDRTALAKLSRESGGSEDVAMFDSLDVVTTIKEVSAMPQFTQRERVVVHALARHTSPARIAEELFVSPNTVKTQLRSAYRKLGVHSRPEALRRAESLGLLRESSDD